jgi:hypothetical protein
VRLAGGCKDYDAAQAASCDCVKSDRAEKRRLQSLKDFYKAHDADNLSKVGEETQATRHCATRH